MLKYSSSRVDFFSHYIFIDMMYLDMKRIFNPKEIFFFYHFHQKFTFKRLKQKNSIFFCLLKIPKECCELFKIVNFKSPFLYLFNTKVYLALKYTDRLILLFQIHIFVIKNFTHLQFLLSNPTTNQREYFSMNFLNEKNRSNKQMIMIKILNNDILLKSLFMIYLFIKFLYKFCL